MILGHGGGGYGFSCYLGWAPGDGERRLALRRHRSGRYFCTMGEALDLSGDPITYANIVLRPA